VRQPGRTLVDFGILLVVVGGAFMLAEKLGLGRLPGDVVVERKGFKLYAPIATSVLISLVLTLLANWMLRK
jgi:hypothetical protein